MIRSILTTRRLAGSALFWAAACVATPLPTPPSVDTERLSLTANEPGEVSLVGRDQAVRVEGAAHLRVTGSRAWTEVTVTGSGAFQAALPGDLADTYYLEAVLEDRDLFLIALSALSGGGDGQVEERSPGSDRDGDGSPDAVDCAPDDASVGGHRCEVECTPELEICDGLDNDCDGLIDEDCDSGADVDGDGFAAPEDCDDLDPSVHPSAPEACDGVDNDCDGEVDDDCDGSCAADDDCFGGTCMDGVCVCPPFHRACGFVCIDTRSDSDNCGDCGTACGPDQTCVESECQG